MVGKQRPGLAPRFALRNDPLQPQQEIITSLFVTENLTSLNAASDDVMQRPGGIYSGLSRHAPFIAGAVDIVNM